MNMDSSLYFDPTLEQMISQHNLEERFSDQLRRLARNDPLLTRLNLFVKETEDAGTASIAQALTSNSTLAILDLSCNGIGDTGTASIAQALTSNSTLAILDLSRNEITDIGAASISQALPS